MAIYHLSVKVISRSKGQSAVASAAYRAGEKLHDLREAKTHDYSRKADVTHREVMAPEGAPDWVTQREALWNRIEAVEKRKDSQLSREVEVALPRELDATARVQLVRDFVSAEFVDKGMIADVAIHNPKASDGQEQPHAHIMLTMRDMKDWEFGGKNRQWNRDFVDGGKSVNDAVGGFANNHGKGNGYVGKSTAGIVGLRARWEVAVNQALEDADSRERIDHRSYADRGIEREAQPKLGAAGWMKERLGVARDQVRELSKVKSRNALRHSLERINSGEALKEAGQVVKNMEARAAAVARQLVPDKHHSPSYAGSVASPRGKPRSFDDIIQDFYGEDFER